MGMIQSSFLDAGGSPEVAIGKRAEHKQVVVSALLPQRANGRLGGESGALSSTLFPLVLLQTTFLEEVGGSPCPARSSLRFTDGGKRRRCLARDTARKGWG